MANNYTVLDGAGNSVTFKDTDNAGVKTPHVNVDALPTVVGATDGAAVVTDANGTLQQYLRGLVKLLITSGTIVLGAGTNAIGKLAANSGVDIGDVDVTSLPALPVGANVIGKVGIDQTTPGTTDLVSVSTAQGAGAAIGATSGAAVITDANGTLQQYLRGIVKLLITNGTIVLGAGTAAIGKLAANSGVDIGDVDVTSLPALPAGTNAIGSTKDNGAAWTSVFGVSGAAVVSANATSATAVTDAPTGGQKLVIDDIVASTDTAMSVLFEEETSGTDIFKVFLPANGTVQITPRDKVKLATADKKLTAKASVAGNVAFTVCYHSEA